MLSATIVAMLSLPLLSKQHTPPPHSSGLELRLFDNTALAGTPISIATVIGASFNLQQHQQPNNGGGFSAELVGTIMVPDNPGSKGWWDFQCNWTGTTLGFVWIDGKSISRHNNSPSITPVLWLQKDANGML